MSAYARLGMPKVLALEEKTLEARFQELGKQAHPDAGGSDEEFEILRRAYEVLKNPASRLQEALEEKNPRGSVATQVMDLFGPVADGVQKAEAFLTERTAARSELGRALLDTRVPALKKELEALGAQLHEVEKMLTSRFEVFDQQGWQHCQAEMSETARGLTFVTKWQAQLRHVTGKLFEALMG